MVCLLLVACQPTKETKAYDVLVLISDMENPFFMEMSQYLQAEADLAKLNIKIVNTGNNLDIELERITEGLEHGVKAILLNPVDYYLSSQGVLEANDKNVPVVLIDRGVDKGDYKSLVKSDNFAGGQMVGRFIKDIGFENILIIEGIEETSANQERVAGFKEAICCEMSIKENFSGGFNRQMTYDYLTESPQILEGIDVIFAVNDEMALGALDYCLDQSLNLPIIGFDGTHEAREAVVYGYLLATVSQMPSEIAIGSMDIIKKVIKGDDVDKEQRIPLKIITQIK
jgi:ribose transport system substrate-binding protein